MGIVIVVILITGGLGLAYWKVEGFRKLVKGIFNGSGDGAVTSKDIERAKQKLVKEKEKTAALQDWAATQKAINEERNKQAAARLIIQGGKK